jgi:hypothetical protein
MQLPEEIIIDGLEEHTFRRSIETMLRNGRADEAELRLKALLPEVAGPGKVLPARLLEIGAGDIRLGGWDKLAARIEEYSRPMIPITAVGIGIGDPADAGLAPDAEGNLRPPLETSYYSDATYPFSETDRADLLEGYSSFGCEWQGDHDKLDDTLSIEGIDDLYGAIAKLENEVGASGNPPADDIRAGAIGACYLGVLVWQAVRKVAIEQGLPRPLAILLVNSDAYPFFDAPVMTCEEYLDDGALQIVEHASAASADDSEFEEPGEAASLVDIAGLGAHRETTKKMALVLDGAEADNPLGMADDLVAQAAFDPTSVDISRFMPDAADFRNEPDEDDAEPPIEGFAEPEYPVETLDTWQAEPDPAPETSWFEDKALDRRQPWSDDEPDLPEADAVPPPPLHWDELAPASDPVAAEPEPDLELRAKTDTAQADPVIEAQWENAVPEFAAEAIAEIAAEPAGELAAEATPETSMPWHGRDADLPYTPGPGANPGFARPSSHSIRARIRTEPVAEAASNKRGGLLGLIVHFLNSIRNMLLRR